MPKNTKSSASSATRKKKAQKAAKKGGGQDGQSNGATPPPPPPQRGQKKGKGKEPKKKVYIPPTKPKQDTIDPLDSLGLAGLLPSDLVVLLRKAGKKDVVTRSRALEGLVEWMQNDGEVEERDSALVLSLPCWAHLFPRLAVSPNRRLRQLTSQINSLLLDNTTVFPELLSQPEHLEAILGGMLVLAFDPDRQVGRISKSTWERHTTWQPSSEKISLQDQLDLLLSHLSTIIFHQSDESVPVNSAAPMGTLRDAKNRDDINVEEDLEGTDARLVHGALGALGWLISSQPSTASLDRLEPLMASPTLWTCLSAHSIPQQRSVGCLSPIVRAAAWQIVRTMAFSWPDLLDKCLPTLAYTAMQSAFEEGDVGVAGHMREGLVTLVRTRPRVWKSRGDDDSGNGDDDEGSQSGEEDGEESGEGSGDEQGGDELVDPLSSIPSAFTLFLDWLSSGLRGAYSNYNIIIVLLSTMPTDVLPPTSACATSLLASFYKPIDERTIEGRESLRLFVPAFLECLVWMSGSVCKAETEREGLEVVKSVETFYVDFVGTLGASDRPGREDRTASVGEDRLRKEVRTMLRKLGNINITLASPLLDWIKTSIGQTVFEASPLLMDRNVDILKLATTDTPTGKVSPELQRAVNELVADLCLTTSNIVASGRAQGEGTRLLTRLLTEMPSAQSGQALSSLHLVFTLLCDGKTELSSEEQAHFFVAYIATLDGQQARWQSWTALLDSLSSNGQVDWPKLNALMTSIQGKEGLVEGAPESTLDDALRQHYNEGIEVVQRLMAKPQPFVQPQTVTLLLNQVASDKGTRTLPLLASWLKASPSNSTSLFQHEHLCKLVPNVARLAVLEKDAAAASVWDAIKDKDEAGEMAAKMLKQQLMALDVPLSSVLEAVDSLSATRTRMDVLPDQQSFLLLFSHACSVRLPSSLAVLDPLASSCKGKEAAPLHDESGLTSYCRCCIALLEGLEESGSKAAWTLPHLISLALAGEDSTCHAQAGMSHFAESSSAALTLDIVSRAIRVATSVLSSVASRLDEAWYAETAKQLKEGVKEGKEEVQSMLLGVWATPHSTRILARLLKGIINFSGAGEREGVHLLRLAQSKQDSQESLSSAVYATVKELVLDSPVYERIRNELAARLAGVPPSRAGEEGLRLLRLLLHVAPPTHSSIFLIPQQRCIFLLQTLQRWVAADESDTFPAEMDGLMMELLSHLLPIVQDMPGSHLAFMCDQMDVNLSDGMDNLVCVYHSLNLVDLFHSLAERNATLREVWKESRMDIFENIHNLFLLAHNPSSPDQTTEAVEDALTDVLRFTPESLFASEADVGPLVEIVKLGKRQSQILAYRLLSTSIRERVKELVIDVAVGGQGEGEGEEGERVPVKQVRLAEELISLVESAPLDQSGDYAFLLAWLALFEHFEESSLQLKALYTSQIQALGLVESTLLPFFFSQTGLTFDPSRWALDEVYLDEVEPSPEGICVLTAHVFYRSLIHIPNLIRESFNGLKDRQQSLYLRNFIIRHLTPLLSLREFSHLRDAATIERITDENMSIKVLAGSSEVIATYTVDEYPLEISIGMPNDYPLRNVEIKDLKKIGVSEGTWRAWILSIRQLIAGRNGLIFDALMLFKRNVEAKFSGFDEDSTCAVCYSIVSPTDHSLPTKPCKTCKKKFHASCLYKWVSTSGSSTCPLCRSIL